MYNIKFDIICNISIIFCLRGTLMRRRSSKQKHKVKEEKIIRNCMRLATFEFDSYAIIFLRGRL